MKFIEKLNKDYENGVFDSGLRVKGYFSAKGIKNVYEAFIDGMWRYYTTIYKGTNGYKIISEFITEKNIPVIDGKSCDK